MAGGCALPRRPRLEHLAGGCSAIAALARVCHTHTPDPIAPGSNHCVAICDGWVFDFNEPRALRMQDVAALDACCLHGAEYVAVYAGFQLTRGS